MSMTTAVLVVVVVVLVLVRWLLSFLAIAFAVVAVTVYVDVRHSIRIVPVGIIVSFVIVVESFPSTIVLVNVLPYYALSKLFPILPSSVHCYY